MNTQSQPVAAPDDILTYLPSISGKEYKLRAKMRSYRNIGTAHHSRTKCEASRSLAWLTIEYASGYLFEEFDEAALSDINKLCNRLILTALQAEKIHDEGPGA